MRQVVLDTETTGLSTADGHRVIEIGCVELVNRRLTSNRFHRYIRPEREIDAGAIEVHGISNEMLADKPLFAEVVDDFMAYIAGSELIIHNAPFDVGFLDYELSLLDGVYSTVEQQCQVLDTLKMARYEHPGQRNTLDALCKRYDVDNSKRDLHGALLDAELLADVYLAMTGGQASLLLNEQAANQAAAGTGKTVAVAADWPPLLVVRAQADDIAAHDEFLKVIDKESAEGCLWLQRPDF
ncbi:MAG: DNA polymerase III subunit epsilon [Gammaproteobacteria bacterium]|nr:MAG: DNA polymerase III subunit epsilon [Gammaproteobacteria bacterium]RLA17345.1 MAG: DNA polymerase III subunit epsilon [Gammaproteobacteria bacterium]